MRANDTTAIPKIPTVHVNHRPRVLNTSQSTSLTTISRCTMGSKIHHRTRSGPTTVPNHSIHRSTEPTELQKKSSFNHATNISIPSSQRATSYGLRLRTLYTRQPPIPQTSRQHHSHDLVRPESSTPRPRYILVNQHPVSQELDLGGGATVTNHQRTPQNYPKEGITQGPDRRNDDYRSHPCYPAPCHTIVNSTMSIN